MIMLPENIWMNESPKPWMFEDSKKVFPLYITFQIYGIL